ncbi:MAG: family 43 glycosylhydrolase, partial [Armatimonadota bacterium]|nr:family 43 glycosylhydrolase [Armatimonadota bacterium]
MNRNVKFSRRALLQLAAGASAAALASRLPAPGKAPKGRTATFQNPLFAGDFADPTILRVGEDFYFTHNFFRYAPALVIWHSRDLVNWTPISHVLNDSHNTPGE